ncbi:MAG: NUDIX hydrolase [Deltaproteobacteria bacterium]|nr:NUDIX hydrolase [Deltaproteobacteria bacterium]
MTAGRMVSAGGVIFRIAGGGAEVALISVSPGKRWGLPKGLVEKGEGIARTAYREVREETGLDGKILKMLGRVGYFFQLREDEGCDTLQGFKRVFKIVYFFLMEYTGGDVRHHDEEVTDCRWFPINEAIKLMKFDDEKDIIRKARKALRELGYIPKNTRR